MPKSLYGQLTVLPHDTRAQADLIGLINDHINPPSPLTLSDVHVRALRLVSDAVNDHGGRFPVEEHQRLCDLLIDSPVMIGHDHARLPVARNFAARCMNEGESSWVEVWFYWLKGDGPHHDQLAADIDAGVVKEGSIGFEFALPQCSICVQDIRTCEHIPGFEYNGQTAHYEYRNIQRVLETSLVYRGATPGTRIVKYPLFAKLGALTRPLRGRPLPVGEANNPEIRLAVAIGIPGEVNPPLIGCRVDRPPLPHREFDLPVTNSRPGTLPLQDRSLLQEEASKQYLSGMDVGEIDSGSTHLPPSSERARAPLPPGEVALRSESEAERVRGPLALPAPARAFLAAFREIRSFYCPARSDLWSRSIYEFRAGHRPPALRSLGVAGLAKQKRQN